MDQQLGIFGDFLPKSSNIEALIDFNPKFFDASESDHIFEELKQSISWKQEPLVIYGKKTLTPRLTAWYGDPGITYRYSGVTFESLAWTRILLDIKSKVELFADANFNSVLLNFYRDGNDSMSWHSDDEKELGINPLIASVNFGQSRRFDLRKKDNHHEKKEILLTNGSILVMKGNIQHEWQHQVAKSLKIRNGRINLTFRLVKI